MTKKEFLDILGSRLAQTLSQEKVGEHVRYYDSYLSEKISQGYSEEEAVEQLGDPLLIARTIMDTGGETGGRGVIYEETQGNEQTWSVEDEDSRRTQDTYKMAVHTKGGCLLAAIIAVVVLVLVLWMVGSVVSILLPVVIPVLIIVMVVSYFKQK